MTVTMSPARRIRRVWKPCISMFKHYGTPARYDRQGRLSPGADGLRSRPDDPLCGTCEISGTRRSGRRAGKRVMTTSFQGLSVPCRAAATACGR
ncbi:hypothetical protein KIF59_01955 [Enterobacter cloacae subsp. cloacae]|nr:hypothetical protein [Enterobacter cloacae subsp. cloacae]